MRIAATSGRAAAVRPASAADNCAKGSSVFWATLFLLDILLRRMGLAADGRYRTNGQVGGETGRAAFFGPVPGTAAAVDYSSAL